MIVACINELPQISTDNQPSNQCMLIIRIRITRISLFRNEKRSDFINSLNISRKPILWVLPLPHRLPKQQHG